MGLGSIRTVMIHIPRQGGTRISLRGRPNTPPTRYCDVDVAPVQAFADEPISLEQAQAHCHAQDDETELLETSVAAARSNAERQTRSLLVPREVVVTWRNLSGNTLRLPRPPLQSVSSVEALEGSSYSADAESAYDVRGSTVASVVFSAHAPNKGRVTYTAGYATVPPGLKAELLREVALRYDYRGKLPEHVSYEEWSLL